MNCNQIVNLCAMEGKMQNWQKPERKLLTAKIVKSVNFAEIHACFGVFQVNDYRQFGGFLA
jgi:hypothetical protein